MIPHRQARDGDARSQIRVVLLESHRQLRAAMVSGLRSRGFGQIASCGSLQAAIQALAEGEIDLLLVDLDDGWREACDLLSRVRGGKCGHNPFAVAIALTSAPEQDVLRAAIDAGFDDILVKPLPLEQLFRRVWRFTEGRRRFVVTHDYTGPDRRRTPRPDAPTAPMVSVPNTLAEKFRRSVTSDALRAAIAAAQAEIAYMRERARMGPAGGNALARAAAF
ncbi:MAG: response regulator [Hyphomicrobiales bacterium]|nr:response regulator [Hyphomicrobiales bacterium]